jgi:hypothetical protein
MNLKKYKISTKLFCQQMHYLLKHKMLQFVFKYLYTTPTQHPVHTLQIETFIATAQK